MYKSKQDNQWLVYLTSRVPGKGICYLGFQTKISNRGFQTKNILHWGFQAKMSVTWGFRQRYLTLRVSDREILHRDSRQGYLLLGVSDKDFHHWEFQTKIICTGDSRQGYLYLGIPDKNIKHCYFHRLSDVQEFLIWIF